MKQKKSKTEAGFSLTELLVGVGIMGIVALAMATMFTNSFNDMRSLKESLAMRDLETRIRQTLLRPDYASCLLRGRTLNTTTNPATWTPAIASMPFAYQIPAPAMPAACTALGGVIAEANVAIGDSAARIATLSMTETLALGVGNYSANLTIAPDVQSLVRSLRPIRVPIQFRVDLTSGTPEARPFLSVDLGTGPGSNGVNLIVEFKCADISSAPCLVPPMCPAGWTEIGQSRAFTAMSGLQGELGQDAGYRSRHCEAPIPGGQHLELKCADISGAPCLVPPMCPAGWTEIGQSRAIMAMTGLQGELGQHSGYRSRHCTKY